MIVLGRKADISESPCPLSPKADVQSGEISLKATSANGQKRTKKTPPKRGYLNIEK